MKKLFALLLAVTLEAPAATKIAVTVVEQKTGRPISDLQAADFTVLDDRTARPVEAAEFSTGPVDVMLLLDTSLVGEAVRPVAQTLIAQLQPKEQMAIVSFHSAADLIQDFTASKELLMRAVAGVRYGNTPRLLDALYAAIDGGFRTSPFRRVILLLTAGMEGSSRTDERTVIRLAASHGVSIFPIYMQGGERSLFETLARETGGASFSLRQLHNAGAQDPGPRIFEVVRGHYVLTLSGNLSLGEKLRVEVKKPEKIFASALALE